MSKVLDSQQPCVHCRLQLAQRGCGRLHPRESKVGVGKGWKSGEGDPQTPEPLSHSMVLGKHWPTFFMHHPLSDSSSTCSGPTLSQGRMLAQQPQSLPSVTWQRTLGRSKPGLCRAGAQRPQGLGTTGGATTLALEVVGGARQTSWEKEF